MAKLETSPNIPAADEFFAALLAAHEGLSKEESDALNARLILILANHLGDMEVLEEALKIARNPGAASGYA